MSLCCRIVTLLACMVLVGWWPGDQARAAEVAKDPRLEAARRYVEKSDRYLHHSKLRRGMKGYGLTVLAGTEIVRFDAEIVSVMTRRGAHQDVILARLSGQGLKETGVVTVPGSGFGEKPGSKHFRIVFLAPEDVLEKACGLIREFKVNNY